MQVILQEILAMRPRAVIIDSIQTVYLDDVTGSAGSVSQVRQRAEMGQGFNRHQILLMEVRVQVGREVLVHVTSLHWIMDTV